MKKKLALALVFVMGLSFTACGKTTVSDSTNEAVSGGVQSTDTNEDKVIRRQSHLSMDLLVEMVNT
mgnify:CR=1 FL=1